MRTTTGREAVARVYFDDEDGTLVTATGTPVLTVMAASGATITPSAVTGDGTGVYKATIPPLASPDRLTLSWSATVAGVARTATDVLDVTSGRLAQLWQLRQDSELATADGKLLRQALEVAEDWFRDALGFPPMVSFYANTFMWEGGSQLVLPEAPYPKALLTCTVNLTTLAPDIANVIPLRNAFAWNPMSDGLDPVIGRDTRLFYPGRYTVTATHGGPWTAPPQDLQRACRIFVRYLMRGSSTSGNYPERASQVQTESALITFSVPSPDRPTGLPEVDAVVQRYALPAIV
jgi:hypothetical protein